MPKPYQRKNTTSNTQLGIDFEAMTFGYFRKQFPSLEKPLIIPIGYQDKKQHKFDMGNHEHKVIIE